MVIINRRFAILCTFNTEMKKILLLLLLSSAAFVGKSQSTIKDSIINCSLISFNYGFQIPGADMKTSFGNNSNLGLSFGFKKNHDWMFEAETHYLFGSKVNISDSLVQHFATSDGYLIGINGFYDQVVMNERGFDADIRISKICQILSPNPNSGVRFGVGMGFIQHRINIVDLGAQLPQLQNDYIKGYDRLTNGLELKQNIDYVFFDPKRFTNLFFGFDVTEGFTANRRSWNFDTMSEDTSPKLDLLFGFHLGWYIPFYGTHEDVFYYN